MTYAAIAEMAADADLLARCTACAVEQGEVSPEWWVQQQRWALAATPWLGCRLRVRAGGAGCASWMGRGSDNGRGDLDRGAATEGADLTWLFR